MQIEIERIIRAQIRVAAEDFYLRFVLRQGRKREQN